MSAEFSILILILTACAVASGVLPAHSDPSVPLEYQIKAAFLYRFIEFVEWPEEALPDTLDTITIGVLGESDIKEALETLVEGKQVRGHQVEIKHFGKAEPLEFCHVLFIGRSEKSRLREIPKMLKGWSTLTVGEVEGFARFGGMINFIIVENKVRFEINVRVAEKADLQISSKVLRLASIVKEK